MNEENLFNDIGSLARYISYKQHWSVDKTETQEILQDSDTIENQDLINNQLLLDLQKREREINFIEDEIKQIESLTNLGAIYHNNLKDYKKAKELHLKAYDILKKIDKDNNEIRLDSIFKELLKTIFSNISNGFWGMKDYEMALNFSEEFEKDFAFYIEKSKYLKLDLLRTKANFLKEKGNLQPADNPLERINDLKRSLTYIDEAIKIAEENTVTMELSDLLNFKGVVYKLIGWRYHDLQDEHNKTINFKEALKYYKESAERVKETDAYEKHSYDFMGFNYINLKNQAITYSDLSQIQNDTNYLHEAEYLYLMLLEKIPIFFGETSYHAADLYKNYAKFLILKNYLEDAKKFAEKAFEIFKNLDKGSINYKQTKELIKEINELINKKTGE